MAILARHKLMPRQYLNRGDRLVFSNGVITLALIAVALLIVFDAEVSRLIQLYVIGVFTAFTLSQSGMVKHWLRTRETGWRRSVVINSVGAVTTGVVLVVVALVKFSHGAWIVLLLVRSLVLLMLSTRRHYLGVAAQLKLLSVDAEPRPTRILVLVAHHRRRPIQRFATPSWCTRRALPASMPRSPGRTISSTRGTRLTRAIHSR